MLAVSGTSSDRSGRLVPMAKKASCGAPSGPKRTNGRSRRAATNTAGCGWELVTVACWAGDGDLRSVRLDTWDTGAVWGVRGSEGGDGDALARVGLAGDEWE